MPGNRYTYERSIRIFTNNLNKSTTFPLPSVSLCIRMVAATLVLFQRPVLPALQIRYPWKFM